jgi:hypothetical protein
VAVLERIPDADFETGDPLDAGCIRGVLVHVLRAGYGYGTWICDVLDFPKLERTSDPKTLTGRAEFLAGFAALGTWFPRALAPLTDAHVDGPVAGTPPPHFRSRWGEDYGIEQMLEHAICHNLRHRRQLERWPRPS